MSEAASLRVNQQRIVRKILNYHLGDKVIMIDKSEKVKKEKHVKHMKHEFYSKDGRRVALWHRSLPELLQFYIVDLGNEYLEDVKSIEICLGGDHGKGSCMLMALIMKRCYSPIFGFCFLFCICSSSKSSFLPSFLINYFFGFFWFSHEISFCVSANFICSISH